MPDQKYAPLRSEEDGDGETSPPRWRRASSAASNYEVLNLKYFGINVAVFTCGIIAGFLLRDARSPRTSGIDQMAQYSMVPCESHFFSLLLMESLHCLLILDTFD